MGVAGLGAAAGKRSLKRVKAITHPNRQRRNHPRRFQKVDRREEAHVGAGAAGGDVAGEVTPQEESSTQMMML